MSNLLKISEAASLALHTMMLLAKRDGEVLSNSEIAENLDVSENHLSKVMQRLAKVGIVKSARGPRGGFALGRDADEITLLDVYEAIEGPLVTKDCLLKRPVCGGDGCILGGLLGYVNSEIQERFANTKLSEVAKANSSEVKHGRKTKHNQD